MDLIFQPALVAALAALKGILYDEYMPENPHLWVDVGIHAFSQLVSTGVTMEFLVPMVGDAARLVNPVIHGGLSGVVKENFIDQESVAGLAFTTFERRGRVPPPHYYTFEQGFLEGAGYGTVATGVAYTIGF